MTTTEPPAEPDHRGGWRARLFRLFSGLSIRVHLTILAVLLLGPAVALAFSLIQDLAALRVREAENRSVQLANDLAADVSAELDRSLTILRTLSFASSLESGDHLGFYNHAKRAIGPGELAVLLLERDGLQLVNTSVPWGSPLATYSQQQYLQQVRESRAPLVTDLFMGPLRQRLVVNVIHPLLEQGEVHGFLVLSVPTESILDLIKSQDLGEGWVSSVADKQGRLIARSQDHERFAGKFLGPELMHSSAVARRPHRVTSIDGQPVLRSVTRTKLGDWIVAAMVPEEHVEEWVRAAVRELALRSVLLLGLAAGLVFLYAERLSAAVLGLIRAVSGQPVPTLVREVQVAGRQLSSLSRELRASEERLRLASEVAGFGIYDLDEGRERAIWSSGLRKIVGWPDEESEVSFSARLAIVHPDDRARVEASLASIRSEPRPYELDYRIVRPDGTVRWVLDRGQGLGPRNSDTGRLRGGAGILIDITERKRHEEQITLLLREVNHRAKNMLALVLAIARHTAASEPEEFLERFGERIMALAAGQDLLVESRWKGVAMPEVVRAQLAHLQDLIGKRILVRGPDIRINANAAQTLGMALHELATNAGKHGALSNGDGRVEICWELQSTRGAPARFVISWIERDGPDVRPPTRNGFGTTVIGTMARMSLGAEVHLEFEPGGLRWRLACPTSHVVDDAPTGPPLLASETTETVPKPSRRWRILIVEDEALIGLDLARTLDAAGLEVTGPAGSVAQARALLGSAGCDAAVLDVNLGRETSEAIAQDLSRAGIPFVALSGYARDQRPPTLAAAPFLTKPVQAERLIAELHRCLGPRTTGSGTASSSPSPVAKAS